MDTLSLCLALAPMAVIGFSQLRPFLFGKRELEESQNEVKELKARLEKSEAKLEEVREKAEKSLRQVAELKAENLEMKSHKKDGKEEAKRMARLEREVAERAQEVADRNARHESVVRGMLEELAQFKERLSRAQEEARQAKEELVAVQELAAKKERAAQERREERREERVVVVETPKANLEEVYDLRARLDRQTKNLEHANEQNKELVHELKTARAGVDSIRLRLQDLETINRVLRRKVEHNRRAYIITESQLELALDDLYFQKHGKPRRETDGVRLGQPDAADMSAEDLADDPSEVSDEMSQPEAVAQVAPAAEAAAEVVADVAEVVAEPTPQNG